MITDNKPSQAFETLDLEKRQMITCQVASWTIEPSTFPQLDEVEEFSNSFESDHGLLARQWLFIKYEQSVYESILGHPIIDPDTPKKYYINQNKAMRMERFLKNPTDL